MPYLSNDWRPGSFTRNFAWGTEPQGLKKLRSAIRLGFDNRLQDVSRSDFRGRIIGIANQQQQLIPVNFFLFNYILAGDSYLLVDELVYQALEQPHSSDFDRLAVFALNLSHAGQWVGSENFHRYPAEWARNFIIDQVAASGTWDSSQLNAEGIQSYLDNHPNYHAETDYKISRNLARIFELGGMKSYHGGSNAKWWSSAVFLAFDRICADRSISARTLKPNTYIELLDEIDFWKLTGVDRLWALPAAEEVATLYSDCGGIQRFASAIATSSPVGSPHRIALEEIENEKASTPVVRVYAAASRQVRDRAIVRKIRSLYSDQCAVCGKALRVNENQSYCEVGHIKPVGKPIDGPDNISNTLPFCPNHHKVFDRGGLFFSVSATGITVQTRYGDHTLDGRPLVPHTDHSLQTSYLSWHRQFFD